MKWIIFRPMKTNYKNPHTFDMSNYLQGLTFVVGGKDFDQEEKVPESKEKEKELNSYKLDWSFLKKGPKTTKRY